MTIFVLFPQWFPFLNRLLRPPPLSYPSRPPACTAPPPSTTLSRGKPRSQRSSVQTAHGMAAARHRTVLSRTYWSAPTRWNHRPICWDRIAAFRRVIPAAAARVLMSAQGLIGIRTEMISSRCMTNRLVWIPVQPLPCLLDPHRKTLPLRYRVPR